MSVRIVSFADGFTSASAPSVSGAYYETYILNNNQSLTNISGLIFSSSSTKSVFFDYEIERIGTTTYRQTGTLMASYNGSWSLTTGNYQGDSIIEDTLVNDYSITLSIDSSSGQVKYSSGNQTGHTSSKIKLYIVRIS